jgi:hypothetical protein
LMLERDGGGCCWSLGCDEEDADEEVVCEGEKTREERDAELRGEAVSLDE